MTNFKLTEEQQRLYKREMEKIKRRIDMSTKILSEHFLFNIVSCECATLQLRMVLEGIGMSTLVVNETNYKKIYPDKNIEHEWRATSDKRPGIFERIKSFNPNFYPKPMVESVGLDGRRELKEFVGDFSQSSI